MRRFLLLTIALAACDSSAVDRECIEEHRCIKSVFKEDPAARDVSGIVWLGLEAVPGATLRVEPGEPAAPLSSVADGSGFYRFRNLAARFDITASIRSDVITYRNILTRFMDPSFPAPPATPRAWSASVTVVLTQPLAPGHTVAFFASGDGVYSVTGDVASGLKVAVRDFTRPVTLHAVEYEASGGLLTASAYGTTDVIANAGAPQLATFRLDEIEGFGEASFDVRAAPGFVAQPVDIFIGYTLNQLVQVTSIPVGVKQKLPLIPKGVYTYRSRATTPDGAIADSGEKGVDVYNPNTVELPAPPTAITPLDGETRGPGESFTVDVAQTPTGPGVFEHVFEPAPGNTGATVRVVTATRDTTLPDVRSVSATASGAYTWSVRNYPKVRNAEGVAGQNARRFDPFAQSKPRPITLR
jgi:hypothetical protein